MVELDIYKGTHKDLYLWTQGHLSCLGDREVESGVVKGVRPCVQGGNPGPKVELLTMKNSLKKIFSHAAVGTKC